MEPVQGNKVVYARHGHRTYTTRSLLILLPLVQLLWGASGNAAQQPPSVQWQFDTEASIHTVRPTLDGGALIAAAWTSNDGLPCKNAVYLIKKDGSTAWSRSGDKDWRISIQDATPDGKNVLVALTPKGDRNRMKLVLLNAAGETAKETRLMEDSNWVWLSPDGKLVLRWVDSENNLLMEELMSGKMLWSLKSLPKTVQLPNLRKSGEDGPAGFVQPVWEAGCVLVGDAGNGNIEAISIGGKHLWRLTNMKCHAPGESPVLAGPSGRWLAAMSTSWNVGRRGRPEVEYFSLYNAEQSEEPHAEDTLKLMGIRMSGDNPGEQDQAGIRWRRTISGQGRRSGVGGGPVMSLDLFERREQGKPLPLLTILTDTGLVTLAFDESGNLVEEIPWYVPNIVEVYEAWLLPSDRVVVKRPISNAWAQAMQMIDRIGNVLWEIKPTESIQSVGLDPERRYMTVNMLHKVQCYRLN